MLIRCEHQKLAPSVWRFVPNTQAGQLRQWRFTYSTLNLLSTFQRNAQFGSNFHRNTPALALHARRDAKCPGHCNPNTYTEKTSTPFPFKLNEI